MSETSQISKLGMPKWGLSMTQGTVVQWLVEEGTEIEDGDEIVEVESEKINNAVESPASGVLRRQVGQEGDEIPVGGLLGVIAASDVSDEDIDAYVEEFQENFVPEEEGEAGPEPEIVDAGGKELQYLKVGEAEDLPVVLLHGFGGDINIWVFNQETLAERGHTVYALDLPGHGASTKDVGSGDLDFFVETLSDFLDTVEVEKAHLVGHSMGGAIVGSFAKAHPDRVASLILIASAGLGEDINEEYIEGFIAANRRREMKKTLEMLFANPDLVTRQLVQDVMKFKRLDEVDDALRAVADKVFPDGKQADVPDLSEVSVPILAIWGSEDQIIPVSHSENLPEGARVEVLEETGHMPQMEAAGKVNRLVGEFLDGQEN